MEKKESEVTTLIGLQVMNKTNSHMLVRRYNNKIWSIPTAILPEGRDPSLYIYRIIDQLSGEFSPVGFKYVLDGSEKDEDDGHIYNSILYRFTYTGIVAVDVPDRYDYKFEASRWVTPHILKSKFDLNYPTDTLVRGIVK